MLTVCCTREKRTKYDDEDDDEIDGPNQASAVDTKCRLEVGRLVEIVLKALTKRVTVGPDKIGFHF